MRIFLTGGTGFIGTHVLRELAATDHQVVALRRPGACGRLPLPREPEWVEGPLDGDHRDALRGCDTLIHLAACGVSPQPADWNDYFHWNVQAALRLWLAAVRDAGVRRLIVCGTCLEYGRAADRYDRIPTDAPLEPLGAYAASKAAAALAALSLCREFGCELVLLRLASVFGDGQYAGNFWPALRTAAQSGADFPMTEGRQISDFIPAADAARTVVAAVGCAATPGRPLARNVGSGQTQSLRHFAENWWRTWAARGRLLPGARPYRPNEIMRLAPLVEPLPGGGKMGNK